MSSALLQVEALQVSYGAIQAVRNVSFSLNKGEILTLIGCNGAGKSSTLRAISGLVRASKGRVLFKGEDLTRLPAHEIVRRGLAQSPEGRGIFLNLTVWENLDLGAWSRKDKAGVQRDLDQVMDIFPRLKERRDQISGTMSGGELQMLAIARALMAQPDLLLLDEPSLGLAPQLIQTIFDVIQRINREGRTVLLVEQNALQALKIAHQGVVLETGEVAQQGRAADLLASDSIRKAYLGL